MRVTGMTVRELFWKLMAVTEVRQRQLIVATSLHVLGTSAGEVVSFNRAMVLSPGAAVITHG